MTRTRTALSLLSLVLLAMSALRAIAEDPSSGASRGPTLTVAAGGQFSGALVESSAKDRLAWQSPLFNSPFEFPLDAVAAIRFSKPTKAATPGEFDLAWQLVGGDVVIGKLKSISAEEMIVETAALGELKLPRARLSAVYRVQGGSSNVFEGPEGLSNWTQTPKAESWVEEDNGALRSTTKNARIARSITLPDLARIELELQWRQSAAFTFEIGKPEAKPAARVRNDNQVVVARGPSFRLEVVGNQLAAVRETSTGGDIAPIQEIAAGAGELHLLLFVDQKKGAMSVCKPSGEVIAKVESKDAETELLKFLRFSSGQGDLRVATLRVSPWSGVQPAASKSEIAGFTLKGGEVFTARVDGFDAPAREWALSADGKERKIKEAQIDEIRFAPSDTTADDSKTKLVFHEGMQLSGECLSIGKDQIVVRSPTLKQDFPIQCEALLALYQRVAPQAAERPGQRLGRIEAAGLNSTGWLVNYGEGDKAVVAWLPKYALHESPIPEKFAGKIVYRELPPPPPSVPDPLANRQPAVRIRSSTGAATIGQLNNSSPSSTKNVIHLKTGDILSAEVLKIDEQGVEIRSNESAATFIAHKDLRAIELITSVEPIGIPKAKKDRLLMLPRSQRESPPTHLIRSVRGDYLRCRILSMDENNANLEVRLENKQIRRNTIARIIWLHPEETKPADQPADPASEPAAAATPEKTANSKLLFQSIPETRKRLTFEPRQVSGNTLMGTSKILGDCKIDLESTSVLLIGAAIGNSGIPLAYEQWKLRPAPEPLAASESSGDEGGGEGMESSLVGKPAPAIELAMLDGKKFSLANRKSKVLILDFWASWCGPCIQAMPQIHQVAEEFAADGVELLGVNLEETPERITATLKRLELEMPVALDADGRVAERYGASSIPQTVIIDSEGKVARVFVGGGPRFADQLRQALKAVTGKLPPAPPAP